MKSQETPALSPSLSSNYIHSHISRSIVICFNIIHVEVTNTICSPKNTRTNEMYVLLLNWNVIQEGRPLQHEFRIQKPYDQLPNALWDINL